MVATPLETHTQQTAPTPARLYRLYLPADRRQHVLRQPVELIKAAPGAGEQQAGEDAAHRGGVEFAVAIEHQDLGGTGGAGREAGCWQVHA